MKNIILITCIALFASLNLNAFTYEDPADYPLMGDWVGEWLNPWNGHEKKHPAMAAKLLPVARGRKYRVIILPELYNRAQPYLDTAVSGTHQRVAVNQEGWDVIFEGTEIKGQGILRGRVTDFVLKKVPLDSPTQGLQPPQGATVLFDGSGFDAWQHEENRAVTWELVDGAMQIVTRGNRQNRSKGLGGSIETKKAFGSMKLHMEFRYPIEADKSVKARGNSGLFLLGMGEIQILNSYTTPNYWNDCGAIYKEAPAKVGAAGPPLEWQTYDVELEMPQANEGVAYLTVRLNGKIIHNRTEMPTQLEKVKIGLQDHGSILQFRNIWLVAQ